MQKIINAENSKKAAFEAITARLQNTETDPLTQLRLIADKSPEPIKNWLNKLTNDAWHCLMQEAGRYIDTSWQEQVIKPYQTWLANRFPINKSSHAEINLKNFAHFFGDTGVIVNFYRQNLQTLVDTGAGDWRWKTIDNQTLPFSTNTLRQIQLALQIHRTFFAEEDGKSPKKSINMRSRLNNSKLITFLNLPPNITNPNL